MAQPIDAAPSTSPGHEALGKIMDASAEPQSPASTSQVIDARAGSQSPHSAPPFAVGDVGVEEEQAGPDLAEMALRSRLQGKGETLSYEEAYESLRWALDVERFPEGFPPRPYEWIWSHLLCCCGIFILVLVAALTMLILTRSMFRSVSVDKGVLLASGAPSAFSGEEPVASTAVAVEKRTLAECATLATETLGHLRDVVFMHKGAWMSLRIAHVTKFRNMHVLLQGFDGTAIRLLNGRAYLRKHALGSEEQLSLDGSGYSEGANSAPNATSSWIPPLSYFRIVRNLP